MLDFTSALYLGLRHESWTLAPWSRLTTGKPAALAPVPGSRGVAEKLAALQGCDAATLAPSTLHLFWDLFGMMTPSAASIYVDSGAYPIARWGVERAAARGVPVKTFSHHDPDALRKQLEVDARLGRRPVVVADGLCPGCGGPAPVAAYLEQARAFNGRIVLDDTQALGILGYSPGRKSPYGEGGGGMLRWSNTTGSDVVVISSLAKGFGAPLAALSGSAETVNSFEARSDTMVHCSPPSIAAINAARQALAINDERGESLRLGLARLVHHFRTRLAELGLSATGGLFPVQNLSPIPQVDAPMLYKRLLKCGVRAILRRSCRDSRPCVAFLITARHNPSDIHGAIQSLGQVVFD
jgi:8-amino-7-oxononanoate synthase